MQSTNNTEEACPSCRDYIQQQFDQWRTEIEAEQITEFTQAFDANKLEIALEILTQIMGKSEFYKQIEQQFAKPQNGIMSAEFEEMQEKFNLFHQVFKGPWITT